MDEVPVKPPITEPITVSSITALGSWLVSSFGPTETILIAIAGLMLGVVMGWMPSPMMKTMQDIRDDQMRRAAATELMQEREKQGVEMHQQMISELRTICIHDSTTDAQKEECYK